MSIFDHQISIMLQAIFSAYRHSFSGLSRETWLLSAVIFVNRCGYMAVPFMGLYVTQSLGRPESDAGIIISFFGIGAILGAAVGGKLTDLIGFRPVQVLSSIFGGLFFLSFAFVQDFTLLCALAVLISFFYDAFRPANFTSIAAYASPGTETRSYSLNRLATNLGWAIGISLGGIIAAFNYRLLFLVDGLVSVSVGLAILIMLPVIKDYRKKQKEKAIGISVLKPWKDGWFLKFMALTTVFVTCSFLMFRVVPVFFKQHWHLNEAVIGLLMGLNGVIIALFEMVLINKIENKRSAVHYIVLGVGVVGVSFALFLIPGFTPILLAALSITFFSFGEMLSIPFINTFVIKRSNELNRGQYAAGYTLSWSVGQVVGPTLAFYVAEHFSYTILYAGISLSLFCCAYGYYVLNFKELE